MRLCLIKRTKSENMSASSIARLESMLHARNLDRTVVQSFSRKPGILAETGQSALDELLAGGFVRGHLSEIVGPRSSGRMSLLASVLAAATGRGEIVALIDTCDRFDPVSAAAAGVELSNLLWVRGRGQESSRDLEAIVKRALKAMSLVLDAGGFGVVAFDLADLPARTIDAAIRACAALTSARVTGSVSAAGRGSVAIGGRGRP